MTEAASLERRRGLHRRAVWLEYFTVGWNVIEGVAAIGAGIIAGSVALIGFGVDSAVEVISALGLLWRLRKAGPDATVQLAPAGENAALDLGVNSKVYPARMALTVSALADQAGLSADTVRYYERVGLLPEPARSAAGYRLYDQAAVGRLRLIKGAQRAGLRLREIGELLQVADQGQCPCGHTETLLRHRLAEVRAELDRLRALEADLVGLLERQPDPACPDMTAGAAAWWCAPDYPDPCQPSEGR